MMTIRQLTQIICSIILGYALYYGYRTFITGMNPFLMVIFGLITLMLLVLNILTIRRTKNRIYSIVIFVFLGLILPIFLSVTWIRSIKHDEQPRRYYHENNVH